MRGAAVMLGLAYPCIVCSDARGGDWEGNCLETLLDEVWIWHGTRANLEASCVRRELMIDRYYHVGFVMIGGKMEIGKGQGVIPKHCGKQKWRGFWVVTGRVCSFLELLYARSRKSEQWF